jgi:hypothetical protein
MASVPTCGACKIPYPHEGGCKVCLPAKARMVFEDYLTLDEITQQAMRLLRQNLDRLDLAMNPTREDSWIGTSFEPKLAATSAMLSRAVANLMREARQLEHEERGRVGRMGRDQQAEVVLAFLEDLPDTERQRLLRRVGGKRRKA